MAMRAFGILVFSLSFALAAVASEAVPFKVNDVLAQQQQIRADMVAGKGRYAKMPEQRRNVVLAKQDKLFLLLEGKQDSDDLNPDHYMEAFATLESIEAVINNADGERLVCTREKTLGSNRATRVCRTVAQMEAERELARRQLNQGVDQLRR